MLKGEKKQLEEENMSYMQKTLDLEEVVKTCRLLVSKSVGFIRPHSVHKMRSIATDGVVWSLCLSAELIEMPFGKLTHKEPCIRRGSSSDEPIHTVRGDKLVIWTQE